jgi:osmotically-inducible protein OsmY
MAVTGRSGDRRDRPHKHDFSDREVFCQMDRSDQRISNEVTEAARSRLDDSPYKSVKRVLCQYDGDVLFLRGRLPSFFHKQLAQEAVLGLNGGLQVINEIEVTA